MKILLFNPSQILTIPTNGKNFKRGSELSDVGLVNDHSIEIENDRIKKIIPNNEIKDTKFDLKLDLTNKIILPGLVECHTHLVFAGSRANEFNMKLAGKTYEEIAESGGGINSTVKSVRESTFEELLSLAKSRVQQFIEQGVTTLEIKSGYGLSFYDEIKILQVIKELNSLFPIDIKATFLGAHTFPPEYKNDQSQYIKIIVNEIIPFVAENNLASSCDAFCERTAFSPSQVDEIFTEAKSNNLNVKLHTNQFNSLGGIETALRFDAQSIDHLEIINDNEIEKVAESNSSAVLLPGVSFSLKYNYAPARKLIEKDAIVSLATDFNPGSSHINNISMIWGLAALNMKMKIEEIISSYTINAAKALSFSDQVGSIEVGKYADFSIFNTNNYNDLVYSLGQNLCTGTIKKGKVIYEQNS